MRLSAIALALGVAAGADPYRVRFDVEVTTGPASFVVEVHPDWAPIGAARFRELVDASFFTECRFFRVIKNFMVQFGINGDPEVANKWRTRTIKDDPVKESNTRGKITFAKTGMPNSRSTQFFINFKDNANLDGMGFAPFGEVVEGMDVVDAIYKVGEGAPSGPGPEQGRIQSEGNACAHTLPSPATRDALAAAHRLTTRRLTARVHAAQLPEGEIPAALVHQLRHGHRWQGGDVTTSRARRRAPPPARRRGRGPRRRREIAAAEAPPRRGLDRVPQRAQCART